MRKEKKMEKGANIIFMLDEMKVNGHGNTMGKKWSDVVTKRNIIPGNLLKSNMSKEKK